jgi:hypothetical protein
VGKETGESLAQQTDEASNSTCPSLGGGIVGPKKSNWVDQTLVGWKQFPRDDGGREADDNGNILKHVDGYERLVTFSQVSNHTKCNMLWPFDNPPEPEGVGETSCTGKASVLPTFVIRFKFDYVGNRR